MTDNHEEFENWLSQTPLHSKNDLSKVDGVYLVFPIQFAFTAWQAQGEEIERLNARVKELESAQKEQIARRLEALQKQPAAYMTHHDEPMLFLTEQEAASYCEDDEKPNPLIRGD